MNKFVVDLRGKINSHRLAIFCSVFVGILFILPQVLARIELGANYQGAPFLYQSDDENYLANIQEIIDGHLTASSPVYYGHKDIASVVLPFGEYLYAVPAILFHVPIITIVDITKFVFPALLFLLVYYLIYSLIEDNDDDAKFGAIAGGMLVVLGYDLINLGQLVATIKGVSHPGYSSAWARLVNPITGALFLLSFLLVLWNIFNRESRTLKYAAGILLAIMTGYFFSFAMAFSITALLLLVVGARGNMQKAKSLLWILGIGVIPATVAAVRAIGGLGGSGASHTLTKIGLFFTHVPLLNKFLLLAMVIFAAASFFAIPKKVEFSKNIAVWWWYSASLLLGAFLVFVQQFVTGVTIWPQHFVQYSIPIVYIVGIVALYKFLHQRSRKIWLVCASLILVGSAVYGSLVVTWYRVNMTSYLADQRYAPMYAWLNTVNSKKDCVVLISEDENYLSGKIPAYTHCDVYYSVQNYYGVPQERVEHGYLSWLRLRGITSASIVEYLNSHMAEVRADLFTNWLELWRDSQDPWLKSIRNEKELSQWEKDSVQHIAIDYRNFLKENYKEDLNKYKLDYVVWDSLRYPEWSSQKFPFLDKVFESNGLVIYRVLP